jgi:hypothetical protein
MSSATRPERLAELAVLLNPPVRVSRATEVGQGDQAGRFHLLNEQRPVRSYDNARYQES